MKPFCTSNWLTLYLYLDATSRYYLSESDVSLFLHGGFRNHFLLGLNSPLLTNDVANKYMLAGVLGLGLQFGRSYFELEYVRGITPSVSASDTYLGVTTETKAYHSVFSYNVGILFGHIERRKRPE